VGEGGASRSEATGEGFVPQTPRHRPTAKRIREFARKMRREPTDAEAAMWRLLRDRRLAPFKFRRQVPFQNFILDFVCFERRIVIEIDGSQHASSGRDTAREVVLMAEGFRIARYWSNDVLLKPTSVLEDILAKLAQP
jgi:very-short-patch-repair endonuclease